MPHYLLISYWVLDNQEVVMPNRVVDWADTEFFFAMCCADIPIT